MKHTAQQADANAPQGNKKRGRPRRASSEASVRISVRMTQEELGCLDELSALLGGDRSRSETLRWLVVSMHGAHHKKEQGEP